MKNRVIALLLAICCFISLCSCTKSDYEDGKNSSSNEIVSADSTISLAYNSTDSFNPFTAVTSINLNIATLIFDSLFYTDETYTAQNNLADSYKTENNICTVTLKDNIKFSDGSLLTADDVVYSFNAAKANNQRYAIQLGSIENAAANGKNTVIFSCIKNDPYIVNLLTFPIIKSGSDMLTDEDNVALPPIGCGRYTITKDGTTLTANTNWHGGKLNINSIRLINAPDEESLSHAVEIGAIDIYYTDLSDGKILRMSGSRQNINLNNLVYIGVNQASNIMQSNYIRQAISAALDRKKICETAFYTNAIPATGIFNPVWEPTKSIQSIQTSANSEIAIENLEEIGYNGKDSDGYFVNANGNPITVRLLVNEENQFRLHLADMVVSQLQSIGIKVDVEKVPYTSYTELLEAGSFDLYIGEVNILDNMDMTQLLCVGGSAAYGIVEGDDSGTMLQDQISNFYNGAGTINDIAAYAISEMPIIPVCYRTGVLLCGDDIKMDNQAYSGNIFYSINSITVN